MNTVTYTYTTLNTLDDCEYKFATICQDYLGWDEKVYFAITWQDLEIRKVFKLYIDEEEKTVFFDRVDALLLEDGKKRVEEYEEEQAEKAFEEKLENGELDYDPVIGEYEEKAPYPYCCY